MDAIADTIRGKEGLVVGIANDRSIAYGCARVLRRLWAELAVTCLNPKAEPHVRPPAEARGATLVLPFDVEQDAATGMSGDTVHINAGAHVTD